MVFFTENSFIRFFFLICKTIRACGVAWYPCGFGNKTTSSQVHCSTHGLQVDKAIDLRSNRNRPMNLSRRKLRQQTRKWRSVDFLLISLSRHFYVFSTWFQGETNPIHRQYIIVTCRLSDIGIRCHYFFMSEPFLDLKNIESSSFNLGFD